MVDGAVNTAIEQILVKVEGEAPQKRDIAIFAVGGKTFQILEQTIRSRGQTLLADLLDDIERTCKIQPIHVEGDGDRFRYILDWFRFGSILIPSTVSMAEMKRECSYFGLPDDIKIEQDLDCGACIQAAKRVRTECVGTGAKAAAHALFLSLYEDPNLLKLGKVLQTWESTSSAYPSDWPSALVRSAIFDGRMCNGGRHSLSINELDHATFKKTLDKLADDRGCSIEIKVETNNKKLATVSLIARDMAAK